MTASRPLRVLIVEDTPERQKILISLFCNQAWMLVHTAHRALSLLSAFEFDLVSLDYNLAGDETGEDVARRIATLTPMPRVIVHSLNPRGVEAIRAILPGAVLYPVSKMARTNARMKQLRAGIDALGASYDWLGPDASACDDGPAR